MSTQKRRTFDAAVQRGGAGSPEGFTIRPIPAIIGKNTSRKLMRHPALFLLLALSACAQAPKTPFSVVEATIPGMQEALASGSVTSRELVQQYLVRIATYDKKVNAVMTVNPRALQEADTLDRERQRGTIRGPLHGIPIAIKDNIQTVDMPTTGGALAFEGFVPPFEATVVKSLRDAGAIIIAKTGMTEWANWMAGPPTPGVAAYNPVIGYGLNPYDTRRDPRTATADGRPALLAGGSSSGIGTTVSFWAASVGTETSGSILSPANLNMLAGIKPTVGRISRHGIAPLTADQDTAGPMARTVTDAAILLGALEDPMPDPNDPLKTCQPPPKRDYTAFLKVDALKGARIGIPRAFYYDPVTPPGLKDARGGINPEQQKVMAEAIALLRAQGATVVDPANIPSVTDPDPQSNFLRWEVCRGTDGQKGKDSACSTAFKYSFKRDFNKWLASLGPAAPVKTLTELREWNIAHKNEGALKYGQSQLDISDAMDLEADRVRYAADRAKDVRLSGARGIDEVMRAERLDAILFPIGSGAILSARPGYPTVIVPFALVANAPTPPFPDGFNARPTPFGVSFAGGACSEPRLIGIAYAFEQATRRRVPPPLFP
jgi:amidase